MNESEKLAAASAAARSGDYPGALKALNDIDASGLSPEERDRLTAGREYIQQRLPIPPSLETVVRNLKRASADPKLWDDKPQSGGPVPYLSWQTVAELLDQYAPGWQLSVSGITQTETTVAVTVELEINGVRRQASSVQERYGKSRNGQTFAYPAPLESAERRAMVRAATLFGCGAARPSNRNQNRPPSQEQRRSRNNR